MPTILGSSSAKIMSCRSVNGLYEILSLQEVKRALEETENSAKTSSKLLINIVATRYRDLIRASDTVGTMVHLLSESVHIMYVLQHSLSNNAPDFERGKLKRLVRAYKTEHIDKEAKNQNVARCLQTCYRSSRAIRLCKTLRCKRAAIQVSLKRLHSARDTIIYHWRLYRKRMAITNYVRKIFLAKKINSLLVVWSNQQSWKLSDAQYLLSNTIIERSIGDVKLRLPCRPSAPLFIALHAMNDFSPFKKRLELVFENILGATIGSLARYQLLFDMIFAKMGRKLLSKVVEILDPIDHTLMGGLVIDVVKVSKRKSKILLYHNSIEYWDFFKTKRVKLENEMFEVENLNMLSRASQCSRFTVAALRQLPRRNFFASSAHSPSALRTTSELANNSTSGQSAWWW
jgi:hypothetical protein